MNTLDTKQANCKPGKGPAAHIQTKLNIGKPNDSYEQEADRVADKVVGQPTTTGPAVQKMEDEEIQTMPISKIQRQPEEEVQAKPLETIQRSEDEELQAKPIPGIQRMEDEEVQAKPISTIQRQPEEELQAKPDQLVQREAKEELQMKSANDGHTASTEVSTQIERSKGGGSPLSAPVRSQMESGIGADFGNVRIHTGSQAENLSQQLNAQAFTVGNDVYFNKGKYNPESQSGKHLLAHELTHTVQQSGGLQRQIQKQDKEPDNKTESTQIKNELALLRIVAIVMSEGARGESQEMDILPIYWNLYKKYGEPGLKKSSAYKKESDNYKLYMTVMGVSTYAKDEPSKKWMTVPDKSGERKAKTFKEYIEKSKFFDEEKSKAIAADLLYALTMWIIFPGNQPNPGWMGQGNMDDINLDRKLWRQVRAYYWRQKNHSADELIKIVPAKNKKNTQFIFDTKSIEKYWKSMKKEKREKLTKDPKGITTKDIPK